MESIGVGDPSRIGSFAVLGRLGAGGMGQVYLGRSPGGRLVAIKVVLGDLAEDPRYRRRFAAEIAAMRRIGGFWTAAFVDADADADAPWLATEYIAGPSLTETIAAHGPLPASSARLLAAGLAESLAAIHAVGLVHRDLKPSNVLLASDGPRVIDFGIARMVREANGPTRTGHLVGTPGFLSPEQAGGDEVGPASDVFGVGLVVAHATTGRSPFGVGDAAQMMFRVVYRDPDLDPVPEELRPVVAACLRRDPAERPTPAQVLGMLGTTARPMGADWLPAAHSALVRSRSATAAVSGGAAPDAPGATSATDTSPAHVPPTDVRPPHLPDHPAEAPTATAAVDPVATPPSRPDQPPARPAGPPMIPPPPVRPAYAPTPPVPPAPSSPGIARRRLLIGGSVVAAALAGGGAYLLTRDEGKGAAGAGTTANPASSGAGSSAGPNTSTSAPNGTGTGVQPPAAPLAHLLPEPYRSERPLVVGMDAAYPPNEFLDGDGRSVVGMSADLIRAIGQLLGVKPRLENTGFDALIPSLAAGRVDLVVSSMFDTRERANTVDFVDYFTAGSVLLVAKGNPRGIRTPADLCGAKVAVQRGTIQEDLVARAKTRCGPGASTPTTYDGIDAAAKRIAEGGADVGVFDLPVAVNGVRTSGGALEVVGGQIDPQPYGIALRKTDTALRDAVRQALERLLQSGEYRAILDRWQLGAGAVSRVTVNSA
ncbi:bifunctional serine/threonine-protein kinase/transporter substrate-binding domain-containing protein [Embleya hyalina]|uniref:bifunctional serine/threonine-protein kinase/transporter substrate-binding domain-containing protein n=1 Tax=Embleya hyalina TaxID=516124 RepID=UPI001359C610|nr:bifunctional serine/threonine-protein kinase/transporter substrate-binding domain-containing protein [Embleya hyalina]